MELVPIPKFDDVFPGEDQPSIKCLLSDIPSQVVISTLAWINSELQINQLEFKTQLKILKAFIERSSHETRLQIINNIHDFSDKYYNNKMTIFPLITSLQFIEYEILNYRIGEFKQISPDEEINIFKAFLIFNSNLDDSHTKKLKLIVSKSKLEFPNENFYRASWPIFINQYEYSQPNNTLIQSYLSFNFIDYLANNKKYTRHVENYLSKKQDYTEYIKNLLLLFVNAYKAAEGRLIPKFSGDIFQNHSIIEEFVMDPLSISVTEYKSQNRHLDFKGIREKPLIRFENNSIAVSNWKYVSDKLFQAFIFDFYHNSGVKKKVSFNDYKSDVGNDFAQKKIFEDLMDNIFKESEGVCLIEQSDLVNFDYYYRKNNKIILFEFKDITIKYSDDYEKLKEEIDKKLFKEVHNGRESKKGVLQLVENIGKINKRFQEIDDFEKDGIDKSRIIVYPVIIYTHKALGMPGINDYLAEKFIRSIDRNHGFFMIRELIMIDFEIFINCFDNFSNGEIHLIDLLENYLSELALYRNYSKYSNSTQAIINKFKSFEEVSSKLVNLTCNFLKSSRYQLLKDRLFKEESK
ncbi:MAG: hypothetical protein JXR65_10250 [Bacteroidales bacterium]|nr:hypothetical protein [Bacteroidales bacterium]